MKYINSVATLLWSLVISAQGYVATEHPNIVFFLVDDMGWRDAACYGSELYETPWLDQLASEGVLFTQAYASHPRCVPSRYSILTGRFPARAGIPGAAYNMDSSEFTLAEAFKQGGYTTFFAGKWHLEKEVDQRPEVQGFDINMAGGKAGAPASYFYPYTKSKRASHRPEALIRGLETGESGEYLTDRLTDETVRFIEQNVDRPFLIYLSHYAVHTPLEAKAEETANYEQKINRIELSGEAYMPRDGTTKRWQDNAVYAAMIQHVDDSLGRVMKTLKQQGIAENTIIIFTSDHGGLSNRGATSQRPLATSNLPLRAGKGHLYEGGIRVPLVVKWPGVTSAGIVTDRMVVGSDHYPTMLQMAGLPLYPRQHLDGFSYQDTLRGKIAEREPPIFWHSPKARPSSTGDTNASAIRVGDWKLIDFYDEQRTELYNLSEDLSEANDLFSKEPTIAARLLAQLRTWKTELKVFQEE